MQFSQCKILNSLLGFILFIQAMRNKFSVESLNNTSLKSSNYIDNIDICKIGYFVTAFEKYIYMHHSSRSVQNN